MNKQTLKIILLTLAAFLGFSVFSKYFEEHANVVGSKQEQIEQPKHLAIIDDEQKYQDLPSTVEMPAIIKTESTEQQLVDTKILTTVDTDVLKVQINSYGDLSLAELKKYPQDHKNSQQGFKILNNSSDRFYIAQTGLLSDQGPDSKLLGRSKFTTEHANYVLSKNTDQSLKVDLHYVDTDPQKARIKIIKRFIFTPNSYLIKVEYIITNNSDMTYMGSMYGRLKRTPVATGGGIFSSGLRTFTGAAINTPDQKYKKIAFADMKNQYKSGFYGGWIAMLEHYFVTAWIPNPTDFSEYQTEQFNNGSMFGVRFVNTPIQVAPGSTKTITANLYIGPKIAKTLKSIAPALDLTVDYGVLWWLCVPLFWVLSAIYQIIGNWGWAIIFTTLFVKLLFYKLSASSYRSMGNLRNLQPRIEALKQSYGSDRQKFSQAVMELYRKEKVNPLGGCLPIIVQIPVFIALYYVLLESVELRQAAWCLWVTDLSAKDPWYILPILMGLSMLLQQKMNPPPPDPMQAKVLMIMPIFFTVLFLQFPSGLMLYWVVNNTLSIIQQMFITKNLAKEQVIKYSANFKK